jgi:hypothetical protein
MKILWEIAEAAVAAVAAAFITKEVAPDVYDGIRDGSLQTLADLYGYVCVGQKELDARRIKLLEQSRTYTSTCKATYRQRKLAKKDRDLLLQMTFLGGDSLATYLKEGRIPEAIEKAYRLQYPELANQHSLLDELNRLDTSQIRGLISGIKGKLFELRYLDYLNEGHLPAGYHATLAESANQPGWDIVVTGPEQHTSEVIQLKATESVAYVEHALATYPHIDVVTTSEVYNHLALLGTATNVSDSGISDAALTQVVTDGLDASHVHMHVGPPALALAIAAWSSYRRDDLDRYEKSKLLGEKGTKSWLAYLAGGALAVATQTWWLAIFGSTGARMMLEKGRSNLAACGRLDDEIARNKILLDKMKLALIRCNNSAQC